MPPAARITDMHVCPMVTPGVPPIPHVGGPILPPGAPTVLIGFLPAATVTSMAVCVGPPDTIVMGSVGVMINFMPAARMGDQCAHGGVIVLGEPTVMIGEVGSPAPGAGGAGSITAGLVVAGLANVALGGTYSATLATPGTKGNPPATFTPIVYPALHGPSPDADASAVAPAPAAPAAAAPAYTPAPPPPPAALNPGCVSEADASKKLVDDTSAKVDKLVGDSPAPVESHFWSSTATKCQARAAQMQPVIDRYQKSLAALPAARACLSVNQIGDGAGSSGPATPCLTRLPDNAAALGQALGLPPGVLTDEDLRDDTTGFRAAVYQSQTDGSLILVARDTQPNSLVDWKTNTDNGQGLQSDQYDQMRALTNILTKNDVPFDMAGYSKGAGLAQEAGLLNTSGAVTVFNAAGIPDSSVGRTATTSMQSLASRTTAFSTEGDVLTFLNQTSDPAKQISNAQWLKDELASNPGTFNPVALKYENPASLGQDDPAFAAEKKTYLDGLQNVIDAAKDNPGAGLFPPVRSDSMNVIPDSMTTAGKLLGGNSDSPNLGKLWQHKMTVVASSLEDSVKDDAKTMSQFLKDCS